MTKIVYNTCYGGFGLSTAGIMRYAEIKGIPIFPETGMVYGCKQTLYWTISPEERIALDIRTEDDPLNLDQRQIQNKYIFWSDDIPRDDWVLAQVVEELGDTANGNYASLSIRELAPGIRYRIDEYDGCESVITIDEYDWLVS